MRVRAELNQLCTRQERVETGRCCGYVAHIDMSPLSCHQIKRTAKSSAAEELRKVRRQSCFKTLTPLVKRMHFPAAVWKHSQHLT